MTQYLIRCSRHYYAGTIHAGRVSYGGTLAQEYGFSPDVPLRPFASRAEAVDAIREIEAQVGYLGSGEYARPTLTPVPLASAPECVRDRVREG